MNDLREIPFSLGLTLRPGDTVALWIVAASMNWIICGACCVSRGGGSMCSRSLCCLPAVALRCDTALNSAGFSPSHLIGRSLAGQSALASAPVGAAATASDANLRLMDGATAPFFPALTTPISTGVRQFNGCGVFHMTRGYTRLRCFDVMVG